MSCGEKIAQLRKANKMTQDELGKILSVTYQAVSKWERGESLPDFTTISQIAKLFNVPISYFEENGEVAQYEHSHSEAVATNYNYIGTCTVCGRMLKADDEYTANPKIICQSCAQAEEKKNQEEMARLERMQADRKEKDRKMQIGAGFDWKIAISLVLALACYIILTVSAFTDSENDEYFYGFLALILPLAVFAITHAICNFFSDLRDNDDGPEGYTLKLSLIIGGAFAVINIVIYSILYASFAKSGYFIALIFAGAIISFTFVSQYMWGNVVREIFTCGGFTFKLPGIIFSLTVESILWMILIKVVLGIVSILVFILTSVIFAVIAILGSVFTFIPAVIVKTVKDKKA